MSTRTSCRVDLWVFVGDSTLYAMPPEDVPDHLPSWAAITNATPLGTIAAGTLVTCAEPMRDDFGRVDRVKITIEGNEYITGYWVLDTVHDSVGPRAVA